MRTRFTVSWLVCALLLGACTLVFPTAINPMPNLGGPTADEAEAPFNLPELPALAPNVNPLTGLIVDAPTILDRRPIIAKISNAPPLVRPQAGLNDADLVFEHYAEGGLTRFSAIYYGSAPDRVGSIRSARLIDDELMPMFDGLLAYSGASIGVEEVLQNSGRYDRTYMGVRYGLPYYWRDEEIEMPHNMFVNPRALWDLAAAEGLNQRPDLRGFSFSDAPPAGSVGGGIYLNLHYKATRVEWHYHRPDGRYYRSSDWLPHYDSNVMRQVSAANIILLYARHRFSDIVESQWQDSVSYGLEIELWPEGDAILLRDGQRYEARWLRPTRESMLWLVTPAGEPLSLKPGNTWIQVFPPPDEQDPLEESVQIE